ncbi:MAG: zinc-finger domain-containing protein [Chromatiaceae bacterium]|nr:zinc-finger domain-containing protein [Chromatiaceae bacterium]
METQTRTPSTSVEVPVSQPIPVSRAELPLCCPRPDGELWNMHPRVWLPIEDAPNGEVTCPYCGAHYVLEKGD